MTDFRSTVSVGTAFLLALLASNHAAAAQAHRRDPARQNVTEAERSRPVTPEEPRAASPTPDSQLSFHTGVGWMALELADAYQWRCTAQAPNAGFGGGQCALDPSEDTASGYTAALGASYSQRLRSGSRVAWTLEERLSLWATNPTAEQHPTLLGAFADVVIRLQPTAWPLRLGVGPHLGLAWLTAAPELSGLNFSPMDSTASRSYLLVGGTARIAVDLDSGKYGSLELSARWGGLLSDYSYRGAQLGWIIGL